VYTIGGKERHVPTEAFAECLKKNIYISSCFSTFIFSFQCGKCWLHHNSILPASHTPNIKSCSVDEEVK